MTLSKLHGAHDPYAYAVIGSWCDENLPPSYEATIWSVSSNDSVQSQQQPPSYDSVTSNNFVYDALVIPLSLNLIDEVQEYSQIYSTAYPPPPYEEILYNDDVSEEVLMSDENFPLLSA